MRLRKYVSTDCAEMAHLFFRTVHTVNAADYTEDQRNAWAPGCVDLGEWNASFQKHNTVVAVEEGRTVGFGDMDDSGYLDRLFVDPDHQGEGIASAICDELERNSSGTVFTTHASITARTFFEKTGYHIVARQEVVRNGVVLVNYRMEKRS